ncbi:MAG: class I SAM-dependent methyltransferase [Patescibacteria group bacterium]|nr:class I SAM-dependent methyltransferase [Patescibacteria group bacterium]
MMTCVWCGKTRKNSRYARVVWDDLDSTWYRCGECGSLMILPRPSGKLIRKVYENDYLNKRLQPHTGVDSRIRYAKEYRPTVFAEYELSLADLRIKKTGVRSILDFGCADGVFLEFCKKHFNANTKLYGTDISEHLLGQAKDNGWNVVPLGDLEKLGRTFDLITLWDVIEHLDDPGAVITRLKKLLSPRGQILLETPRVGALSEQFGEHWPHLLPVQHLSLASKEGMQKFARRMWLMIEKHVSFGGNAPGSVVPQPYKGAYDRLAKKLDFGDVQLVTLKKKS